MHDVKSAWARFRNRPGGDLLRRALTLRNENNVRTGFFGEVEFLALHEALPDYLRLVAAFAYTYGWRRGEILRLTQ